MHTCSKCQTEYDADEMASCPACQEPTFQHVDCPDCKCSYDPKVYEVCPGCVRRAEYNKTQGGLSYEQQEGRSKRTPVEVLTD